MAKTNEYHQNQKFTNNTELRKQDFLIEEKISHHYRLVNKNVLQSWFNNQRYWVSITICKVAWFATY